MVKWPPVSCVKKKSEGGGDGAHHNLVHCSWTSHIIVVGCHIAVAMLLLLACVVVVWGVEQRLWKVVVVGRGGDAMEVGRCRGGWWWWFRKKIDC
jgi:hypothetical protein